MQTFVEVTQVKNDAEWLAELLEYGYDGCEDMYVAVGDFDYNFVNDVPVNSVLKDETYAFMCGNEHDRRCYDFAVDVYVAADGKTYITEEAFGAIG
jgi:hypothetical protein